MIADQIRVGKRPTLSSGRFQGRGAKWRGDRAMSLIYLIAATDEQGIKDAQAKGWERIAYGRFVTPARQDVRLVRRFSEFIPMRGGKTQMVKGSDYEDGPPDEYALERWVKDKEAFDKFVAEGLGEWVG